MCVLILYRLCFISIRGTLLSLSPSMFGSSLMDFCFMLCSSCLITVDQSMSQEMRRNQDTKINFLLLCSDYIIIISGCIVHRSLQQQLYSNIHRLLSGYDPTGFACLVRHTRSNMIILLTYFLHQTCVWYPRWRRSSTYKNTRAPIYRWINRTILVTKTNQPTNQFTKIGERATKLTYEQLC